MFEPIPFVNQQASGGTPLAGASPEAVNVVVDASGAVRRRPGLKATTWGPIGVTAPVVGLHSTSTGKLYGVTGDLPGLTGIWRILPNSRGATSLTSITGATAMNRRPVFCETEAIVAIAGGMNIRKVVIDSDEHTALSGSPYASHIIPNSSRLLANDVVLDRSNVRYSAPASGTSYAGHELWNGAYSALGTSGYFAAEARPDPVVALGENSAEVFAFGSRSFQSFSPDSNLIYATGITREVGILAPYSLIRDDQSFAFLDDRRRFVHTDGRTFNVLSDPIKVTLDEIPTVTDCFGYRVVSGSMTFLVWTFPTEGRTFAYQLGGGWGTWMGWDTANGNWAKFPVTAHALADNQNIVGLSTGGLALLDYSTPTDLGVAVPARVTTGYMDRGADSPKHCKAVHLTLKRGDYAGSGTADKASVAYRDDGGAWRRPIQVSLGKSDDRAVVVSLRSLGVYRRRQWRFSFEGTSELILAGAVEEFDHIKET